jgi:hypothetical protein
MRQHNQLIALFMAAFMYMSMQLVYIQMRYTDTSALVRLAEGIVEEFREANPPRQLDTTDPHKRSLSTSHIE